MTTSQTTPRATFTLDSATGALQVLTPGGIVIASFGMVQQLELLHLVTGAHLQLIARLNAADGSNAAAAVPIVDPIGNPVA